jgi:hypothetical protein
MRVSLPLLLLACAPKAAPPAAPPPVPERAPRDASVHYGMAAYAEAVGDTETAAKQWAWVRRLDALSPWAWLAVARAARLEGDLVAARMAVQEAARLGPGLAEVRLEQGRLDVVQGLGTLRLVASGTPEGLEEAYAASPTREVYDAWLEVAVPPHGLSPRVTAGVEQGAWRSAALDAGVLFDWVPTPDGLRQWADLSGRACFVEAMHAWLEAHDAAGWSEDWASAVAEATDVTCTPE